MDVFLKIFCSPYRYIERPSCPCLEEKKYYCLRCRNYRNTIIEYAEFEIEEAYSKLSDNEKYLLQKTNILGTYCEINESCINYSVLMNSKIRLNFLIKNDLISKSEIERVSNYFNDPYFHDDEHILLSKCNCSLI